MARCWAARLGDGGRGQGARESRQPLEAGKGKE